jgi:hypothetical protein
VEPFVQFGTLYFGCFSQICHIVLARPCRITVARLLMRERGMSNATPQSGGISRYLCRTRAERGLSRSDPRGRAGSTGAARAGARQSQFAVPGEPTHWPIGRHSQNRPAQSQNRPAQSQNRPAQSQNRPAQSQNRPAQSQNRPAQSQNSANLWPNLRQFSYQISPF